MRILNNIKRTDWIIMGIYHALLFLARFFGEWLEEDWQFFSSDTWYLFFNITFLQIVLEWSVLIFIVFYIVPKFFHQKQYFLTFITTSLVLMTMRLVQSFLFPYTYEPILPDLITKLIWGVLDNGEGLGFIAFILLAKSYYESKNEMLSLVKEQKENELKLLKSQVDPHFLFNNLNILDSLIQSDPIKASQYTKRLSSLYRYMTRHKDDDIVSLQTEWDLCQDYLYLLSQRFDGLLAISEDISKNDISEFFIPPAALQTLIENTVKHNVALPDKPLQIWINLINEHIEVINELRPKEGLKDRSGTGLKNLENRIELLTDKKLIVEQTVDLFKVKVPLVKKINAS